jgi:hypothetical protein
MLFHVFPDVKLNENRKPAPLPSLKTFSFRGTTFQKEFEKFYTDHFGFRNTLIFSYNYLKASQLNVSPHPDVCIGKDGWFYLDLRMQGLQFRDHLGLIRYDINKLRQLAENLDVIHTELKALNINFVVVIAPDKQTIYPEYLPDSVPKRHAKTRLDQVLEYLHSQKPYLTIVDLRSSLLKAKSLLPKPLYFKTDTHWNAYGAFIAYQQIMEVLSGYGVQLGKPYALDDYLIHHEVFSNGDIVQMLAMEGKITDDYWIFKFKKDITLESFNPGYQEPNIPAERLSRGFLQPNTNLPRLLMYRDSFAEQLIPFLVPHFSRSVFISSYRIDLQQVRKEKPDIVVLEIVERNLDSLLEIKNIFHR